MLQVGAFMNDAYQAHDGVLPSLFPPGLPVYTGHYHKPHTVEGTSIRYLGSPYQGAPPGERTLVLWQGSLWSLERYGTEGHCVEQQDRWTCFKTCRGCQSSLTACRHQALGAEVASCTLEGRGQE